MKKPKSLCRSCQNCRDNDYCPIKDDYIDDGCVYSCEEYCPSREETENKGYSVIEFDNDGRVYYSYDQRL